jgi:hypothetical protein
MDATWEGHSHGDYGIVHWINGIPPLSKICFVAVHLVIMIEKFAVGRQVLAKLTCFAA